MATSRESGAPHRASQAYAWVHSSTCLSMPSAGDSLPMCAQAHVRSKGVKPYAPFAVRNELIGEAG